MQEVINAILTGALHGVLIALNTMGIAAATAFGVAAVCKTLKWSPVNVTITINNHQLPED